MRRNMVDLVHRKCVASVLQPEEQVIAAFGFTPSGEATGAVYGQLGGIAGAAGGQLVSKTVEVAVQTVSDTVRPEPVRGSLASVFKAIGRGKIMALTDRRILLLETRGVLTARLHMIIALAYDDLTEMRLSGWGIMTRKLHVTCRDGSHIKLSLPQFTQGPPATVISVWNSRRTITNTPSMDEETDARTE
jgi:hypothetical protein